jgi:hypothetical protein
MWITASSFVANGIDRCNFLLEALKHEVSPCPRFPMEFLISFIGLSFGMILYIFILFVGLFYGDKAGRKDGFRAGYERGWMDARADVIGWDEARSRMKLELKKP